MIIIKEIQTGIDIKNPIEISGRSQGIFNLIVERYEGKCFRGCKIIKVNKILRRSEIMINQTGHANYGTINVIFEVSAMIYEAGEIINGVTINNRSANGSLVGSLPAVSIFIRSHNLYQSIRKDQKISVRVVQARYSDFETSISIQAEPFVYNHEQKVYKVPKNQEFDEDMLEAVFSRIKQVETDLEQSVSNPAYKFFSDLLVQPRTTKDNLNIKTICKNNVKTNYIYRDKDNAGLNDGLIGVNEVQNINNVKIITIYTYENIIHALCEEYLAHIKQIYEMIQIYNTEDSIKDHKNLWMILKKSQG